MNEKGFFKMPRALIASPLRDKLSDSAILLYSYLLSLYELSERNGERFRDENGKYYVVCPISTVMQILNCCNNKAESVYLQLEKQNLISRKRLGLGKANLIYVNNIIKDSATYAKNALDLCDNIDSKNAKNKSAEMTKIHTIKNDYYQKDLNNIYPSICYEDVIEDIRNQIEYDVLSERDYGGVLDEIVNLIADTVTSNAKAVRINQIYIPIDKVQCRFAQLTAEHIEYVISSLEKNTTEIKNMRAYLLTVLYNSIDTMDAAALYGA